MSPSANHLGRVKIGQLLAAVGSAHTPEETPPSVTAYDWRDPHYFRAEPQGRLAQALGQVAAQMTKAFTRAGHNSVEVCLQSFTQHFAGDLCRGTDTNQGYCLAFGPEKGPRCGFASISWQAAVVWVAWLLGDSDAARDPDQALSSLEESLLSDLLTALVEAFLDPLRAQHNLRPAGSLDRGRPSLQFERTEEICRAVFQVKGAETGEPSEVVFLLPCRCLAALAGKTVAEPPQVAPQELSRALMEHVQEVPMTLRAVLGSTALTLQEVMELAPGDILLLDRPIAAPVELILDHRTLFRGRPVRSGGQYAMVIVASEPACDPQTVTTGIPKPVNERT